MTRHSQGLLAYLLLFRNRLHPREVLASQFWGDSTGAHARAAFNTALWRVRSAIEPAGVPHGTYVVAAGRGDIGFNAASQHWIDVEEIETRVRPLLGRPVLSLSPDEAVQMAGALDLFNGDLLEGMTWDWVLQERERLRMICLDGLGHLMHYYALHRMYDDGLRCGQRILWSDPLREAVHREMMRLHCAAGQRGLAIRQYATCRAALERELGIDPMPATQALYAQIMNDDCPMEDDRSPFDESANVAAASAAPARPDSSTGDATPPDALPADVFRAMQAAFNHLDQAYEQLGRLGIDVADALRLLENRRSTRGST